eukprot:1162134-Pelagomonas_calceolata.AAC.10
MVLCQYKQQLGTEQQFTMHVNSVLFLVLVEGLQCALIDGGNYPVLWLSSSLHIGSRGSTDFLNCLSLGAVPFTFASAACVALVLFDGCGQGPQKLLVSC